MTSVIPTPSAPPLTTPGFLIRLDDLEVIPPGRTEPLFGTTSHDLLPGRIYTLTGTSGSGKTTLLRAIMGLLRTDTGWKLSGRIVEKPGLSTAWIAQNPSLLLFQNFVHEELGAGPETEKMPILEEWGMSALLHRRCAELSSGEKTLVALAKAFQRNVRLLLLDEIATNLSAARREWIKGILKRFASKGGCVIMAEHSPELLTLADEHLSLEENRLWAGRLPSDTVSVVQAAKPSPSGTGPALQWKDIRDSRIPVTEKISLSGSLRQGEILGIRGDNGSGKSTLLQIVAGIYAAERGTLLWNGKDWKGLSDRREFVSYLPQNPTRLFFTENVEQELRFGSRSSGSLWLETMGLLSARGRSLLSLSGGEQQRLALAVCLEKKPAVLLLDEPTHGMDGPTLRLFCGLLREHQRSGGMTLLVSHDPLLLDAFADQVIDL